jgi:phage gp46-like protein
MALKDGTGAQAALFRNPNTGLYDIAWDDSGNPIFDDTGEDLVLSLLLEYRGKYWADTTSGRRGSTLYLITQDTSATASQMMQAVDLALQLAVDDGRLVSFTRTAQRQGPGRYKLTVNWVLPNGVKGSTPIALGY